jgi:cobalt-zinc-cadmium efflux system outer membrane protein
MDRVAARPEASGQPTGRRLLPRLGGALLVALGLAGCARYQPRPLSAEGNADALEARTLTAPGLRRFLVRASGDGDGAEWPLARWDLPHLVLAAYYFHPDLDVARAAWAVARAGQVTAGQRPNPFVSVLPAYDVTRSVPSPWLVTVTLDVPIETAGKRAYRQARAEHLSEAARLAVASAAWQVRQGVRSALVALHAATASEALRRAEDTLRSEDLRVTLAQLDAGDVSVFDVTQARIAADGAHLALRDAEAATGVARVQLAEAVGLPVRALDGVALSFAGLDATPDAPAPAVARRQAALNRPDVLGALADYAASEAALQLEIAKQYPDLHLNPGYEFDQGENKWALGFTVDLPLLNQNQGPIAEAEARRAEAAARFDALQARVLADVERALAAYRGARRTLADADALRANLERQEHTGRSMLGAGTISRAELLGLRLQLNASEMARVAAVARTQQALGDLENALQSPVGLPESLWRVPVRDGTG